MNKIQFKSRKEASEFLASKNIDTSEWTEEKWQSLNKSQAEIHMQALAEAMYDAYNESTPKELKAGEWHIPFGDNFDKREIDKFAWITNKERNLSPIDTEIAVASARCARLSYMTFGGEIDYLKDIKLHDSLLKSGHMSPFEHCARAMDNDEYDSFIKGNIYDFADRTLQKEIKEYTGKTFVTGEATNEKLGWCSNFKGFIQYRYLIENT